MVVRMRGPLWLRAIPLVVLALLLPACGTNRPPVACSASGQELEQAEASRLEQRLACLIINHPEQQRPEMHYHPAMGEIARRRALDMAENGYYRGDEEIPAHVDGDGYGPDHYLCEAGYRPDVYCRDNPFENTVESIATSYTFGAPRLREADVAAGAWYASADHRSHILGEAAYFRDSAWYGIGHAEGKYYDAEQDFVFTQNMWVFIAAQQPDEPEAGTDHGL